MLIPILPRLRSGQGGVQPPATHGWDFRPLGELKALADSLDVTLRSEFTSYAVDATPDLWARLLLFDFALREEAHPLRKASVSAFRGFLALLALREKRNVNIQVLEVNLSAPEAKGFRAVARRLRPTNQWMSEDTKWEKTYIFTLDGEAIGITSPLTLICPAEGTHLTPLARVPWCFDGFRFRDPTAELDKTDRQAVADWVALLEGSLAAHRRSPRVIVVIPRLLSISAPSRATFFRCLKPLLPVRESRDYRTAS